MNERETRKEQLMSFPHEKMAAENGGDNSANG
jgi:hypothetical protein